MKYQTASAIAAIAALAGAALGQSAGVSISASATSVQPGDTVTVTVTTDYDTAGASNGVFGAAGFYGFGGNVPASGSLAATAAAPAPNAMLTSGAVTDLTVSPDLVRAGAGRGLLGGLSDDPATMLTFDLQIDPGAASGDSITLDYDGAVVLVLGDALTTFSTAPGTNQQSLTTSSLTITVGGGCSPADVTTDGTSNGMPDGAVTLSDFSFYLSLWAGSDPAADVTTDGTSNGLPDGAVTLSDFSFYLSLWSAGCP